VCSGARTFIDAFWFSMQTMNAIGYGAMYPNGYYAHCLTFFQSWLGLLIIGALTAIVFSKLSRPSYGSSLELNKSEERCLNECQISLPHNYTNTPHICAPSLSSHMHESSSFLSLSHIHLFYVCLINFIVVFATRFNSLQWLLSMSMKRTTIHHHHQVVDNLCLEFRALFFESPI
jgi:hypothetical protein